MAANLHNQGAEAITGPDIVPLLSGVLAALVACAITLTQGINEGWEAWRIVAYVGVGLLFLLVVSVPGMHMSWARWLCESDWRFLLTGGALGLGLQALSGSTYAQPIAFTVLFVHATLLFQGKREQTIAIGALFLGLMVLGQWLYGWREPATLLIPLFTYTAVFGFLYAFTSLSITQAAARWRADQLAGELARERDYQASLVGINATLTRELDIGAVLRQVSAAAYSLAQADGVRVWLREADEPLQLAAQYPADKPAGEIPPPLLATEARITDETLVLPLLFGGKQIGALELDGRTGQPFSAQDVKRLEPFANAAAVAIRNAQLFQQSQLSATLAERNRLARELHDTIAQGLTAITMQIEAAQRSLERDNSRTKARLERAASLSRATLDDVRRSVWTLASPLVDGGGLVAALAQQCDQFEERTGIVAHYEHHGPTPTLSSATSSQLLRIAQEALHNAEKHAHAHRIAVSTELNGRIFQLAISDDGIGFDPYATNGSGFGLISLRERAHLAGGELRIESVVGGGTKVMVEIGERSSS